MEAYRFTRSFGRNTKPSSLQDQPIVVAKRIKKELRGKHDEQQLQVEQFHEHVASKEIRRKGFFHKLFITSCRCLILLLALIFALISRSVFDVDGPSSSFTVVIVIVAAMVSDEKKQLLENVLVEKAKVMFSKHERENLLALFFFDRERTQKTLSRLAIQFFSSLF